MARKIKVAFTLNEDNLNEILSNLGSERTVDSLNDDEFAELESQIEADDASTVYIESFVDAEIYLDFDE